MQPIYIDLHIHTSENANNLNTNYDIAELVGQIKKLNGDSPFMISLTDHNTINKSAYLKAQNLDLNLIIGVELHIQNRAEAKSYHCHIYFNAPIEDAVIDSLNEILDELYPNKLPDRNDPNTPDIQKIINSFDTFDFILLPHGSQKHGAFNYSINDGENLDNAINRSIYYNQFDGFTSRSTKGLEATHQYFERLGISEFINLVTCSDNYSPSIYPRSHSGNDDDFIPTWMFAQPTFDGLRLSLSESTRLVASHEKPIRRSDPLIEDANEEINSIKTKLTLAAKAYTMFDDVSMVVKEHKQVVDRILKDELGQQQSRITNKDSFFGSRSRFV